MPTAFYVGNSADQAQADTIVVTAVTVGGTLTATINQKNVTYTCVTGDTVATAATAWQALLAASVEPEFKEITWTVSTATITGTSALAGQPFTLTKSQAGGATCTLTNNVVASLSKSDPGLAANWLRSGSFAIPQAGDDVILRDCAVPILYNLTALAAVAFASFQRWGSFTGQIGLPVNNAAGYREYRPTRLQFIGSGTLVMTLGMGQGDGPPLERYDQIGQRVNLDVSSGNVVEWISTHVSSTVRVQGAVVNVAMDTGEVATIASGLIDGGGQINLGQGVTLSGTLTLNNAGATLYCAGTVVASNSSTLTIASLAATHAAISASGGSTVTWLSNSTLTAISLTTGSTFDKSQDARAMTITGGTVSGDSQVLDPNSVITWTNPITVTGQVTSGPFQFAGSRTVAIA